MIKKLFLITRFCIIASVWSLVWVAITQQFILRIWNFNYLSAKQWHYISSFWKANGTIQGASDYLLFTALLLVFVLWIWWGIKLLKVQYFKLLLRPFESYAKHQIEKYANAGKNVVVKNLVVGQKITLDHLINEKIKEEDANQTNIKESDDLRSSVMKKITESKKS